LFIKEKNDELGNASRLQFLVLSSNRLTGEIPSSLANLDFVFRYSSFSYNGLYTNDETVRIFLK
jgi:hypothetical protein